MGDAACEVGCHKGEDHEITQGLSEDNTEDADVVLADGNEFAVAVVLACCSGGKSDAEQEGLL